MPDALELSTTATTDASLLAETMFGDGIEVVSATLTGAATQAGTYSGGEATSGGVVPSDSGVILSTGDIADFTTEGTGTNTNTSSGTTTNHGGAGDADLDSLSTVSTYDAVVFESTFVPDDDYITMQFVFSSEEYLEYVNSGVNDTLGVWVNDEFVPLTSSGDTVSIDTVNNTSNSNLYVDNPANTDAYNTEMDGFTITLSLKAQVNAGEENTIRIGLADGGDTAYDTNVLIAADSIQTVALAFEDHVTLEANTTAVIDVLANDHDDLGDGLTITEINGEPISVGGSVTLNTGETVTLNSDYTLSVATDSDLGETVFTYTVENGNGTSDVGFVNIQTVADAPLDGIVEGSGGADVIDASFTGDPEGDQIDSNDAIGVNGTTGDDDYVLAYGGDDTVDAGLGDDIVEGGAGDDALHGGDGNDSLYGQDGTDEIGGDAGDDLIHGGAGGDGLYGDAGNDALDGGTGDDLVQGGSGDDTISLTDGFGNDTITGGETGETDGDVLDMSGVSAGVQLDLTANDPEAGSVFENGSSGGATQFSEIENIMLSGGRDTVHLADGGGQDAVSGFDITDSGDGTAVDQLDVSKLTSDGGTTPVTTADVEVTADPYGSAVLTFPNGESITLEGVNPLDLSTADDLVAIGIPDGRDYIVEGSAGDDVIDAGYTGDPEGDLIDAGDALDGSDDDSVEAGAGDDLIAAGAGDDTVQAGAGDDTVVIEDGFGNDQLLGGETGESDGDTLDLSGLTADTTIDLTNVNPEKVTVTDGTDTVTAEEFENLMLGGGEDTLQLGDGGGSDVVAGFDMGDRGDGRTFDQVDVSGLTSDGSTPVTAWDVVVTDTAGDGSGDAVLTFPNGESLTLEGVAPDQVDSVPELFAIGIPCFTPGALIVTELGEKPVEDIRPGDRVLTADNGFQPVRWTGRRVLDAADLVQRPELKPVVIRKGAFGNTRKMVVSPQHGFVMKTDSGERLIRAKHAAELYGGQIARIDRKCTSVTYVHIMFDRHEIVFAEGARTEAFYPGPQALHSVDREAMAELLTLFPELARVAYGADGAEDAYGLPARDYLLGRDIRAMAKGMRDGAA